MLHLRARLVTRTDLALGLAQPDTESPLYWFPLSEISILERHETLTQTILHLQAPAWLVAEKHAQPLTYDPTTETQTLNLFTEENIRSQP